MEVFISETTMTHGMHFEGGHIYDVEDDIASAIGDKAEKVNAPLLKNIENRINHEVQNYREKVSAIKEDVYLPSDQARAARITEVQAELDTKIARLKDEHATALETLTAQTARAAASAPALDADKRAQIDDYIAGIETRLMMASGVYHTQQTLDLMAMQVSSMPAEQQAYLYSNFSKIAKSVNNNEDKTVKTKLGDIYDKLASSDVTRLKYERELRHLQVIKEERNPTAAYQVLKASHPSFRAVK